MSSSGLELLTPAEMAEADRLAVEAGVPVWQLMQSAGQAVAGEAAEMLKPGGRVLVLAGPGNNAGDGFVAAELLRRLGVSVRVALLGGRERLAGEAARAGSEFCGPVETLTPDMDLTAELLIDALFGAGLSRPVDGLAAEIIGRANERGGQVLAVDLPSGIDGESGQILGAAIRATRTATFFRLKPGHLLLPGRAHCGDIRLRNIGIPEQVLAEIAPSLFHNRPDLWRGMLSRPAADAHKYQRGHALVVSGPAWSTGATRLTAMAALRAGAGLVTLASPRDALPVNAAHLTAIMLREMKDAGQLADILSDPRFTAVAIGPGAGRGEGTRRAVAACLKSGAAAVLDADALTAFDDDPEKLFGCIQVRGAPVTLTPHDGEFARLFPDLADDRNKVRRAREAARRSGAIVVLKGPDTVVAAPDGHAVINDHGSPWLATAGSGDVLTGIVAGLAAQRMPAFEAASAAVWLHGEAARRFGPGLIAEDLPGLLPAALAPLLAES